MSTAPPGFPAASSTAPPNQQHPPGFKPNYDIFSSIGSSQPGSQSSTPAPTMPQQTATPLPPADPFAALVSPSSRASTPLQQQQNLGTQKSTSSPSSLLDIAPPSQPISRPSSTNNAAADDEWDFTSALPESSLPNSNQMQVLNTSLRIDFISKRVPGQPTIQVKAQFSNNTSQPISELHFQVAVEKVNNYPIVFKSLSLTYPTPVVYAPAQTPNRTGSVAIAAERNSARVTTKRD